MFVSTECDACAFVACKLDGWQTATGTYQVDRIQIAANCNNGTIDGPHAWQRDADLPNWARGPGQLGFLLAQTSLVRVGKCARNYEHHGPHLPQYWMLADLCSPNPRPLLSLGPADHNAGNRLRLFESPAILCRVIDMDYRCYGIRPSGVSKHAKPHSSVFFPGYINLEDRPLP